jgi:drug/metabolite transporter (DMT)-like permease
MLFGLTVPLTKVALGWLDPAWLTVVRFTLAAPVLAVAGRGALRAACSPRVLAWGAAGYGGMVLLQNAGVERTSVGHAALVFGAVPALVAVIAALAGRGATGPLGWLGFATALAGVGLVAGSGGDASALGDGLVLLSALLSAAFVVAQAGLLRGRDPVALTAVQMTAAALVALPVALAGGLPAVDGTQEQAAAVLALVVAGTLLPFALFAFGQARVRPQVAGAFVNLEPLVGAAVAVAAFGEPVGAAQGAGALAIVAGIALSSARPAPAPAPAGLSASCTARATRRGSPSPRRPRRARFAAPRPRAGGPARPGRPSAGSSRAARAPAR